MNPRDRRRLNLHWAFLDSSAHLALVNPNDADHQAARAILTRLTRERWRTFTTNFILAETHALFIRRLSHAHATAFLREFPQRSTTLIRVESEDEERARAIIFAYHDKQFSYTDGTSFAVMERLGISYGFTFDRDFIEYGLPVLAP